MSLDDRDIERIAANAATAYRELGYVFSDTGVLPSALLDMTKVIVKADAESRAGG